MVLVWFGLWCWLGFFYVGFGLFWCGVLCCLFVFVRFYWCGVLGCLVLWFLLVRFYLGFGFFWWFFFPMPPRVTSESLLAVAVNWLTNLRNNELPCIFLNMIFSIYIKTINMKINIYRSQ